MKEEREREYIPIDVNAKRGHFSGSVKAIKRIRVGYLSAVQVPIIHLHVG